MMDLRLKLTRNGQSFVEVRIVEAVVIESGEEGSEEMNEEDGRSVQEEGSWICVGDAAMNVLLKVKGGERGDYTAWFWLIPCFRHFCGHRLLTV